MPAKSYVTASDLLNFAKCNHKPFMDRYGDPALKVDVDPLIKLLWEQGVQYEEKVIDSFRASNADKTFVAIEPAQPASERLFAQTQQAMSDGIDYIYQGVLISEHFMGRPDLLEKIPGSSRFGNYLYAPMDIKLARSEETWDNGEDKISSEHYWQLLFYGGLLEKIQGVRPQRGTIYKSKSRTPTANLIKPNARYQKALDQIVSYQLSEQSDSFPALSASCKNCEWQPVCGQRIAETNDCTRVYWVGGAMQRGLRKLGIVTVDDLAGQQPHELATKALELKAQGLFWPSMTDEIVKQSVRRARVLQAGKPVLYEKINFPNHPIEIHYDLEDDSTQDFVYLHGLLVVEHGKDPAFHSFFAESKDDEKIIAEQLFDFFKKFPGAPVYHYANHERKTLKRLLARHRSLDQSVFDSLFGDKGTAIDLLEVINNQTDWPLSSYSLKEICRFLGFEWDAEDASGSASVVWINQYQRGDQSMKAKILRYNEDDCRASYFLKCALQKMQPASPFVSA